MIGRAKWSGFSHRRWLLLLMMVSIVCGTAASSASAATNFMWTGGAAVGTSSWSDPSNWGGTAPSGSVGTLAFPALTSAACTASPPTATCYTTNNDIMGLSANELSFDILNSYGVITGAAITLGGGGLNGGTTASTGQNVSLGFPITLGAPQTWSLTGNAAVTVEAPITGTSQAFTLQTSANASLGVSSNMEVGTADIDSGGNGGSGAVVYGSGSVLGVEGELNATDGNTINVDDSELTTVSGGGASEVGPLAVGPSGNVYIGDPGYPGILHVTGGATFDPSSLLGMYVGSAGTTAGTDYSQLSATGAVDLGGVQFELAGNVSGGSCLALDPGDVMTLITTTGALTGTFNGVPDSTVVAVGCVGGTGTAPLVRINYTAHTVTATVVTSTAPPPPASSTTTLTASPSTPAAGQSVTLTATVTATAGTPAGTVSFRDGGTAIAGCSSQSLTPSGSSAVATCDTTFAGASAPSLTAVFTPTDNTAFSGSTSNTVDLSLAKLRSATSVQCDYVVLTTDFQCTAQVADASGNAVAQTPTGSVTFAVDPGAAGGFAQGATCTLQPSQSGPTAFCAVTFFPGAAGVTPGTAPPLSATYSGDATFGPSTGSPQIFNAPPPDTTTPPSSITPLQAFQQLCQASYNPFCADVVPPPDFLTGQCVSLDSCGPDGGAGPGGSGSGSSAESVTISPDQTSVTASASCPVTAGPLTDCEWNAYLNSANPDPALVEKVQYYTNYDTFTTQVAVARAATLVTAQGLLDNVIQYAQSQDPPDTSTIKAVTAVRSTVTEAINQVFDAEQQLGTGGPLIFNALTLTQGLCEGSPDVAACEKDIFPYFSPINDALRSLSLTKAQLGVNVPYKVSNAQLVRATPSLAAAARTRPRRRSLPRIVLAASRTVTLAEGAKKTVRLTIPPVVRAELKRAYAKGVRTLKADFVVEFRTGSALALLRTIPVKIHLKAPRRR
jgi:hypothetical protein